MTLYKLVKLQLQPKEETEHSRPSSVNLCHQCHGILSPQVGPGIGWQLGSFKI